MGPRIASEHFDVERVARALAAEAGLSGLVWDDLEVSPREEVEGKARSLWAVLARAPRDLEGIEGNGAWQPLPPPSADDPLWTDRFSSPLAILDR